MNRLKELREANELSLGGLQKDLLNRFDLKIGRASLNNYERGEQNPRKEIWEKLAEYFDVSVPYLMGLTDSRSELTKEDIDDKISSLMRKEQQSNIPENFNVEKSSFEIVGAYFTTIENSKNVFYRYFIKLIDTDSKAFVFTVLHGIFLTEKVEYQFSKENTTLSINAQFLIPDRYEAINAVVNYKEKFTDNNNIFESKNYDQYIFRGFLRESKENNTYEDIYKQICEYTVHLENSLINNMQLNRKSLINEFRINSLNEEFITVSVTVN